MSLSILNNISALTAQNQMSTTQASLQKTLTQLSTGMKINSGADDAAGLSIANGMQANIAALTQSAQNATNGIGLLQTADGALSQVTALLNRAVTLATEASNGGLTDKQATAIDDEYQTILGQIDNIGSTTNFNGANVFADATVYMSDGTSTGSTTVTTTIAALTAATTLSLSSDLKTTATATAELTKITDAIATVAAARGTIGADINQLSAATNVMNSQIQNLQSANNGVMNADIGKTVANMTQFNILQSTGMAALQQANQAQQSVLKLLQ